eukprot:CAMPEP_0182866516 /NCGR_PEP_ID=MMETSP0034_2-20130328/8245_1 /TAXON_ID=156128 /ORGANISM="Nephroselmis pyriformis, Strain CCMP717" /LENGTH=266 /DNA_ID=CAMNT_0024998845 /DNA_START=90 /DNA_END=887 /DNA_ORIENTATION=+
MDEASTAKVEQFCLLAKSARGAAARQIVVEATTEPGLYAFGELLDMPNIKDLANTAEHAPFLQLLKIFAHGTYPDWKASAASLPALNDKQKLKLKQLTVVSLAEKSKVLPYDTLMAQLDVSSVRALEDLLINDCIYAGIVKGKLDQRQHCFEVSYAAGRDIRPGQLQEMIDALAGWVSTSEGLLESIEGKIEWANKRGEEAAASRALVEAKAEETRKQLKAEAELRGQQDGGGYMEGGGMSGGVDLMDEDRRAGRPKRKHTPASRA